MCLAITIPSYVVVAIYPSSLLFSEQSILYSDNESLRKSPNS